VNTELPVALSVTKANIHDSKEFQKLYTKVRSYKTKLPTNFYIGDKAFLRDNIRPIIKASKLRITPPLSKVVS